MRSLRKRKLLGVLLLVGFGAALVTTFGLVELHDEILKASFQQRVHYPSDVAGGYFVGAVWLAAVIGADLWVGRDGV